MVKKYFEFITKKRIKCQTVVLRWRIKICKTYIAKDAEDAGKLWSNGRINFIRLRASFVKCL